jgi:hypothetical protein
MTMMPLLSKRGREIVIEAKESKGRSKAGSKASWWKVA